MKSITTKAQDFIDFVVFYFCEHKIIDKMDFAQFNDIRNYWKNYSDIANTNELSTPFKNNNGKEYQKIILDFFNIVS